MEHYGSITTPVSVPRLIVGAMLAAGVAVLIMAFTKYGLLAGLAVSVIPAALCILWVTLRNPAISMLGLFVVNYFIMTLTRYAYDLPFGMILDALIFYNFLIITLQALMRPIEWKRASSGLTVVAAIWTQQGEIYFPKRILIEAEKAGKALRFDRLQANSFVWKKLDLTTKRLYSGPLLLTFMLTNQCVTHCKYCYADTSTQIKSPLTTQRMMELIKEASDLQVQQVNLIGGEIFLHKDWKIILKELVKRGIAPEFISTKMPVTQKLLQDVQETGYQGIVQISLDAIHSEILTASLGVNGNYAKEMLHGLQLLDDSGLNYQISSVLTNYNCQLNVLAELLHELSHLKHIRDWRIIPASNSIYKEYNVFSHLKPTKAQITKVFNQIRPLLTQVSFPVILGKEVTDKNYQDTWGGSRCFKGSECSALTTHMFILPDGKVTVCEQLYWHPQFIIGNVTTQSLKEVWHSPQALHLCSLSRQDINKESPCRECRLFEDCFSYQNRCWSDIIKAYGKDCWDFPDPRCCFAPAMKNKLSYD